MLRMRGVVIFWLFIFGLGTAILKPVGDIDWNNKQNDFWESHQNAENLIDLKKSYEEYLNKNKYKKETCQPCPEGYYSTRDNGNCTDCTPGYCPDPMFCTPCSNGTYNDHKNLSVPCPFCPDGTTARYSAQSTCDSCPPGATSDPTHIKCIFCPSGTSNPNRGSTCHPCDKGHYSQRGSLICSPCLPGTYNPKIGQPKCLDCGEGFWNPNNGSGSPSDCESCPQGYYCPSSRTVSPVACPPDHYCDGQTSEPHSCPLLYQSASLSSTCDPAPGFYILIASAGAVVLIIGVVIWIAVVSKRYVKKSPRLQPQVTKSIGEGVTLIPEPLPGPVYTGL